MLFDMHVHSNRSADGVMTIKKIVIAIKKSKLNGFSLTDHNSTGGLKEARKLCKKHKVDFVPGVEVSTREGHLLLYGVEECPPLECAPEDAVEFAHDRGGVAVVAHPYDFFRRGMGDYCKKLKGLDGIETKNGKTLAGNTKAQRLCDKLKLAETGGSDAHAVYELGTSTTMCPTADVVEEIKKKRTHAFGGSKLPGLRSRFERRLHGVPIIFRV